MRRAAWFGAALALLTGCGGGGASAGGAAATRGVTPLASANVTLTIAVPRTAAATTRSPQYVSSGTALVSVTVNGATTSAACVAPATTCSVQLAAPLGSDTFAVALYDASSNLLASGSTIATVTADVVNAISVTFDGVIQSLSLSFATPTIAVGAPASSVLTITAKDSAGFTIIPPGNYTQPIVVTTAPSLPAALSLSGSTTITAIPASSSTILVSYNGAAIVSSVAFTATAGSVNASQSLTFPLPGGVSLSAATLQFTTVPASAQNVTVSESQYAGTFSDGASGCSSVASVGSVVSNAISVTPLGVGTCTVTVSDTIGNSQPFTINVATTSITGS